MTDHQIKIKKILIASFGFLLLFSLKYASAQTAADLQNKISDRNNAISQLEDQIKEYQKQIDALGGQADTLKSTLAKLDLTRQTLNASIQVTEDKITAANLTIDKLTLDIGSKQENITEDQQVIAQGLRQINESDIRSILQNLLSGEKLSDVWNDVEALKDLHAKVDQRIEDLKNAKADLETNKQAADKEKQALVALKSQLNDQKKINDQNTADENKLLKDTKNKESNYNKLLAAGLAKKQAFEKDVRDYESQLKFILDPNSLPKSGSSALAWPLDNVYITQLFGATVDAKRLYTSGSHSGVDFAASVGTPIKSAASGVVMGTGNTDIACPKASYGQWVLIKHANGLATIYGHLSLIKVTAGETVASGQLVGYSGNTGYTTGPHLHLGVFAASGVEIKNLPSASCAGRVYTMPVAPINAYLDPMLYLPPYNR